MTTPPPRAHETEEEADDDGLGKEKATPEKRRLQAQETLVDNGEDAQPTFPSDELPTPFKSTQKDLSLATPKASSREPPIPEPKSLMSSFDNAVSDPPGPTHVLSLAPPETSDGSGDEILQYALQQKMVEVSSGEENWNPAESWYAIALLVVRCCSMFCVWDAILFDKETDIYYGTPLKEAKPEPDKSADETEDDASDGDAKPTAPAATRRPRLETLSKAEEAKLEAVLRRVCKADKKGNYQAVRKFCMKKENRKTHILKDKYQKKLLWYWCDIAYEGVQAKKDEEELTRDTAISSGSRVTEVPLGLGASLPALDSDEDMNDADDDEDDDEDEDGEEAEDSKQPKLGKRKSKEQLDVHEDMTPITDIDGVPDLLDEILKLTKLMNSVNKLPPGKQSVSSEQIGEHIAESTLLPTLKGFDKEPEKVSTEFLAELANAVVTEVNDTFGEEGAAKLQSYRLLRKMSRGFTAGHAAEATRKALETMPENQAPVPVTEVDIGLDEPFPCILFSDYLRTLAEHNKLNVLTQDTDLEAFWGKMQPLLPEHPVFQLPAESRARTLPLYLIGDEGRGWKKSAVFVLGSESVLGTGCDAEDEITSAEAMKMNFRGNTMLTRQLFACMPKGLYLNDDRPLHKLVNIWAEDFAKLFYDGLRIRRGGCTETWRAVVLGLKGDWPALDKLGRLQRHFRREAYPYKVGICHLCMANTRQQWFKGADTTFVLKFLVFKFENVLASEDLGDDRLYVQAVLDCLKASDGFLSSLYKAGLFLWRRRLVKIVRLGNEMIASYTRCAGLAVSRSLARFKLSPKYHMLMHVVLQLMVDRDANRTPVNPMAYSCQMPEDFINRVATLARSVSPRYVPARSLSLYKIALAKLWQ
ncbi:unnamed protein product [Symbiodinium necroappetens]|uniref:Uncharacterized protein n=1 Tax=Symbiodinium necroappetens TaxID=1628268 RepID=A0A812WTJ7_9DINO|nr:unnamed protein product [Symbiodinium necroappetens]